MPGLDAAIVKKDWGNVRWLVEATLLSRGVCKLESSLGSTTTRIPLSAADLPTLLDILSETLTSQELSTVGTSRSKLSQVATSLRKSNESGLTSGPSAAPAAAGSTPPVKRLPSNRKYWPGDAKDVFWNLVRSLNKYDKEYMPGGRKSPIQLEAAEWVTRKWWRLEHG